MNALFNPSADARTFLAHYLAPSGGIHLVSILPDAFEPEHATHGRHFGTDVDGAAAWVEAENSAGRNVYYTANVVRPGLDKKPTKSDLIGIRVAHTDIDPTGPEWNKEAALADLMSRGAPSVVIDSGGGLQALWWLAAGTDVQTIEAVNRGIGKAFGGDNAWNADRLLRLPGTINYPNAKKREAGRVAVPARIAVPFTGETYAPEVLAAHFPAPARVINDEPLPTGPAEGYTGPADDDELIRMMLASRGGMGAMFGDKATISDLWNANPESLAKHFPSPSGDAFDRSSADAALFAHLAFWTGKDPERMDRLYRRSGLMREKYEKRPDYQRETIKRAVAGCRSIYDRPRETRADLPGVKRERFDEMLMIHEQIEYFKGCVYVMTDHKILTPSGDLLKPEQFKAMYGGHVFIMSNDSENGGATSKNAFEAFTENRGHQFPKVARTMFNPRLKFGEIQNNAVNTYFPDPNVKSRPGDVTPMLTHVSKLLPNGDDAEIFWTFCAAMVQNPGVKFQWAAFIQGAEGNGKSILSEMLKYAIGIRYYHKPFAADISNKFNDFMIRKLFIDVQEILLEDRYEVAENLKDWITSNYIEVQPKGGAKQMIENHANWMLTSNHKNAVPITSNQRRFAPLFTAQQCADDVARDFPDGYFPALWEWCRNGGWEFLTHYLQNRPLHPDYNPAGNGPAAARAPITSSTNEAVGASLGRLEQEILECVESSEQGFRGGWLSSVRLTKLIENRRIRISPQKLKTSLDALGYREIGRASRVVMMDDGKRPILYIKRDLYDPSLNVEDYCNAQGFAA